MGTAIKGPNDTRLNPAKDVSIMFTDALLNLEQVLLENRSGTVLSSFGVTPTNDELWDAANRLSEFHKLMSETPTSTLAAWQEAGMHQIDPAALVAVTFYLGTAFVGAGARGLAELYSFAPKERKANTEELLAAVAQIHRIANMRRWRRWLYFRFRFFRRLWAPRTYVVSPRHRGLGG